MESSSGGTSSSTCGPRHVVRRLAADQRVLVLDLPGATAAEVDALLGEAGCVIHAALPDAPEVRERFAVGVVHLGSRTELLRPVADALRCALLPDGVAVILSDRSAVSADAFIDLVRVARDCFAISYVLAARALWASEAAPSLPELTNLEDDRLVMAIGSDASWRLLAVTEPAPPTDELKPIFRLVKEQEIHLDGQRSLLIDFEHRLGVQSQELDRAEHQITAQRQQLASVQAALVEARDARIAADRTNAALTAEIGLWKERYAAVVSSAGWRTVERLRSLVRPLRRARRG